MKIHTLLKRPKYWLKSQIKKLLQRYFPGAWRSSHSVRQLLALSAHTQGFEIWLDREFWTTPQRETNHLTSSKLTTATASLPPQSTAAAINNSIQNSTDSTEKPDTTLAQPVMGRLEVLRIESSGVVTISGWQLDPTTLPQLTLKLNGQVLTAIEAHRRYRPDVKNWVKDWLMTQDLSKSRHTQSDEFLDRFASLHHFLGFAIEFNLTQSLNQDWLTLELNNQPLWSDQITYVIHPPYYSELLSTHQVLHRENIYGYGLPSPIIAADVVDLLAWTTRGMNHVLDFGCGRGNVVELLRSQGIMAQGLELDRPEIREAIAPETAPHIRLYNGVFPLLEQDDQFDCTVSIEVIEHIPDFRTALAEIARVTRHRFVLTVPDISAIPRCCPANVVPWHLLESTHYNFFNENSLKAALDPFWNSIQIVKFGENAVNSSRFCTSVIAICEHKK